MKIAMWSGPRNLSTAMMYAFAQRKDCAVWDEPFYAAYLARSGLDHPMREDIIAAGETNPDKVIARCIGPNPADNAVFYQKHMTHHMLPDIDLGWARHCRNVFLIRHPARIVASYSAKRENPTFDDLGFAQQLAILQSSAAEGADPIIIDSSDILRNPPRALRSLCQALGLPFDAAMLSWPAGPNLYDGVWAPHWYGAIHASTGFASGESELPKLAGAHAALAKRAMPIYRDLYARRLGARRGRNG